MSAQERLGIPAKTWDALKLALGNEARIEQALADQDLEALMEADGVGLQRALEWVRLEHGIPDTQLAVGPGAKRVAENLQDHLLRFACTKQGRNRLRLLHVQSSANAAIAEQQRILDEARRIEALDLKRVAKLIGRLQRRPTPKPQFQSEAVMVLETDDLLDQAREAGLDRWISLYGYRDLEMAQGYPTILCVTEHGRIDVDALPGGLEVPGSLPVSAWLPLRTVQPLQAFLPVLEALHELGQQYDQPSVATTILEHLEAGGASTTDPKAIRQAIQEEREWAQVELENRLSTLQISAREVLEAASTGKPPLPVQKASQEVMAEVQKHLLQKVGKRFQPLEPSLPVTIQDDVVQSVLDEIAHQDQAKIFDAMQKQALALVDLLPALDKEIQSWLDYDPTFALARFAIHHRLQACAFGEQLRMDDSLHLDLTQHPRAQPITYELGEQHRVALLTGANSGGKSTLLEHMTQIVIMAHMGLPVQGKVVVPWLDEVHLVVPKKGLDAGAFETFLRGFLPITGSDAKRLILADEVEAITELEAAGRILGFVIEQLLGAQGLAVFVTHLAPTILEHAPKSALRVDGIEATGLDEHHELIVDRAPKMGHFARSTPELILQRMAARETGTLREQCQALVQRFQSPPTMTK